MKALHIDLENLPANGKSFAGELDPALFELGPDDATPQGPLYYELFAQRFETELLLQGSLSAAFQFTCVRTLHDFVQTISLPNAAVSVEITQETMDVTEALREEILLLFPAHPHCDDGDDEVECEIEEKYLAVDKTPLSGVEAPPAHDGDSRWDALNQIPDPDQANETPEDS